MFIKSSSFLYYYFKLTFVFKINVMHHYCFSKLFFCLQVHFEDSSPMSPQSDHKLRTIKLSIEPNLSKPNFLIILQKKKILFKPSSILHYDFKLAFVIKINVMHHYCSSKLFFLIAGSFRKQLSDVVPVRSRASDN
jgi:hypothetical protein